MDTWGNSEGGEIRRRPLTATLEEGRHRSFPLDNSGPFRQVGALPVRCGAVPARDHVHEKTNSIYASTDGLGR